jgi:hypothetical protein
MDIQKWALLYLKGLSKEPVNGELQVGDIVDRFSHHLKDLSGCTHTSSNPNNLICDECLRNHAFSAAKEDAREMVESGLTIRRINDKVRELNKEKNSILRWESRDVSSFLEESSHDIISRGNKKGRVYRHREARPMMTSDHISALIPKCLDIVGREVKWSSMHPLVRSMAQAFHESCEREPELWIDGSLENVLVWQLDPEKLSIVLIDGRRTLQFHFKSEGIDSEALKSYKRRYSTNLEEWFENCYTASWFNDSSANIQRLLRAGGLVSTGTKRGRWVSNSILENEREVPAVDNNIQIVTSKFRNELNSIKDSFAEMNEALQRLSVADMQRANSLITEMYSDWGEILAENVHRGFLKQRETGRGEKVEGVIDARLRELRKWRLDKAQGRPAYVIFKDPTMKEIAWIMPQSEEELLGIKGIGPKTMKRYGSELLKLLEQILNSENERGAVSELFPK